MQVVEEARKLQAEIVENRRAVHSYAEIGFELPKTYEFVKQKLIEYGYAPVPVGRSGLVCTAGKGGKTILLRADMDALPMEEKSGLPFAAKNGNCHSCGHDVHTAMLLGAAKLLKQHENELCGTIKFMFQPAEELLGGAWDMIENGVLENPHVDAAMALHIVVGQNTSAPGRICYIEGCVTNSGDAITIQVIGKDGHGSRPELAVDAIHVAAHIVIALEELVARECGAAQEAVVLVGRIEGGTSVNSVAGTAKLEVSVRSDSHDQRAFLVRRVQEVAEGIAKTFRAEAIVEHAYGVPPLVNDDKLLAETTSYLREVLPEELVLSIPKIGGSEDFTMVAEKVPSVFMFFGVGRPEDGCPYFVHHPEMKIDESGLYIGTASYVQCAVRWLEEHP